MDAVKFGIDELDGLLGCGLVKGKSYLIESSPGAKPLFFGASFLKQGYKNSELSILGSFDHSYSQIVEDLLASGFDARKPLVEGKLEVLDFAADLIHGKDTTESSLPSDHQTDIHHAVNLASKALDEADKMREDYSGTRIAIHTLSSFIRYFGFDNCLRFVEEQTLPLRKKNSVLIATVNQDMLRPHELGYLEETFDGAIELIIKEENLRFQRYIRVKDSPCPDFKPERLPYTIVSQLGIISVATAILSDFGSLKESLKLVRPGVIDLLGVRVHLQSTKSLADVHDIIFTQLGYELGNEVLFKWGMKAAVTVASPLTESLHISADTKLSDVALSRALDYINLWGIGRFELSRFNIKKRDIHLKYYDSPVAAELRAYGKPVDAFVGGAASAALRMLLGSDTVLKEVACTAKGDEHCEFEVAEV